MRSDDRLLTCLPPPPRAQGRYVPAVVHQLPGATGGLVMTAGMTPRRDGVLQHRGQVGREIDLDVAQAAAAMAVENALVAVIAALRPDQGLEQALRLVVYVNAAADFEQHTAVADGASARLHELLGEDGSAARSAVGVTSLPGGACVELELTCSWTIS